MVPRVAPLGSTPKPSAPPKGPDNTLSAISAFRAAKTEFAVLVFVVYRTIASIGNKISSLGNADVV